MHATCLAHVNLLDFTATAVTGEGHVSCSPGCLTAPTLGLLPSRQEVPQKSAPALQISMAVAALFEL
jgi:hypothetical protein